MKRDKLGHARELSHRRSEKHTNRSRQSAMDLLVMVVLIPTLLKMSGCEATLRVSEQTATWDEARKKCRTDTKAGCLSTGSIYKWLHDGKSPGLEENAPVWLEARFLHKLVWAAGSNDESEVFPKRGCFNRNMTDADQLFTDVHGPYACYDRCYSSTTGNIRIYTQDGDCYCVSKSSYTGAEVDQNYCHTIYEGNLDYSGNADKYYSVYEVPQDLIFGEGFFQLPCFTAIFLTSNGKLNMRISSVYCEEEFKAICIEREQQQPLDKVSGNFSEVKRLCEERNQQLLYLKRQPGGDSGLQTLQEKVKALAPIEHDHFYVDITINSSAFWVDGRQFSYNVRSQQSECIAVVTDSVKGLRFDTRPCNQSYKFICSCPEGTPETNGGAKDKEKQQQSPTHNEIVIAIAAVVTGVVFLAIFIIVAVVLYFMKRSGKLRGRKSSISHSTSRSGEWDQGEASRTWDRSSRSTSIDYIDSKITPLVAGKGTLPAIYENSKSDGSGALTARNGNKVAQNLYDVCGLLDEEKSRTLPLKRKADGAEKGGDYFKPMNVDGAGYAEPGTESRKPKTSILNQKPDTGNGDYADPGGNHYTEVSIEEEQGIIVTRLATGARDYDTPRAQRRNHSSEIDGTGDQKNITKKKTTSAASAAACGSVDATNHPIGDFSSDRHVGPMGDVYTEVRKEAGIGVVKIVGSAKPDPQASQYKVPRSTLVALPANGDKTEAKEIRGEGGNVGIRGPLGDIYAEVNK